MLVAAMLVSALPFAAYADEVQADTSEIEFDFSFSDEEFSRGDNATLPTDETIDIEFSTEDEEFSRGDAESSAPSEDESEDIEYSTEDEEFSRGDEEISAPSEDESEDIEFSTEDEEFSRGDTESSEPSGDESEDIEYSTEDEEFSRGDEETSVPSEDKEITIELETEEEEASNGSAEETKVEKDDEAVENESVAVISYSINENVSAVYESRENIEENNDKLGKIVLTQANSTVKSDKRTVKLSWKKVDDATGYKVYRTYTDENGKKITKVFKTKRLTFKNTTNASEKYTYKVRAYKTVDGKNVYGAYSKAVKG